MSSGNPLVGAHRSEPIVDRDPKTDAAPRRSGLGRFVDWEMCALIGIVGVPSLAYLVWQG